METRRRQPELYSLGYTFHTSKRNCTCVQNMNHKPQSDVCVQKNTQTGKARIATKYHSSIDSNNGYRDLPRCHAPSSRSKEFLDNSPTLKFLVWILANLFILAKRSDAFPHGSSIVANFEQTYCQPQMAALNRAPNHVDPRLCGGTCVPRPVTNARYTLQVNTTEYSIHNVQVDIQASSGANILGFAVVAVSESNRTAGRWVIPESRNPTVMRATCDSLLQGQLIFHARASRDRSRVTVTWDSRRTNFGRIFFRAWIVQRHSEVFVLDSEPLVNRLNASAFVSLETKLADIISGISLQQSASSTRHQHLEPVWVNSTTQAPSYTSVTETTTPSLTSTSVTETTAPSPTSTSVTQQLEIPTQPATSTSVTQQPEIPTQPATSTSMTQHITQSPTSTNRTQNPSQSPISLSVTQPPESASTTRSSKVSESTIANVTSSTSITEATQAKPAIHLTTNNTSNPSGKERSNFTSVDNVKMPSLEIVSLAEFEEAFSTRLSNGYKINETDPFELFNRASYQLIDLIPESKPRRLSNTSLDPFRNELVFETNGGTSFRDIPSLNRPSSLQVSEQTVEHGQSQGTISGSRADQNLGSLEGLVQGNPRQVQGQVFGQPQGQLPWQQGRFQGQPSWQQRQFSGGTPGQSPFQQQGQFPGQSPFRQQGQFPGQSSFQQQGQFPGQSQFQQQGQFPGQSQFQQQGQFPGQSPLQQQGQFPGQSSFQQQGQIPGQSPFQQQGQFLSQSIFQQQGQFPPVQQQGQFPGQSPFQQGQFPGQSPFQQQGQFSSQLQFQQQRQFPSQALNPRGQLPGQFPWQQQGQFLNQAQRQSDGRVNGDNLGFSSTSPGTSWMSNSAFGNLGSNGLNNFPNQAQFGSATSGLPAWNSPNNFGNQGGSPFQNGAFGQNMQFQMLNNVLTGKSNNLQNQNGGTQGNQFGGFFDKFGGGATSRWRGNNVNGFGNFASAGRMFG